MVIIIKKADIENLKDIQNLNLLLFQNEFKKFDNTLNCEWPFSESGQKYFLSRISSKDGCALIAIVDEKVVGYLAGGIHDRAYTLYSKYAELENTFVLEEFRNQTIGSKLIKEFFNWCRSRKIKRVKVIASAMNKRAHEFYRKNGLNDHELILEANI